MAVLTMNQVVLSVALLISLLSPQYFVHCTPTACGLSAVPNNLPISNGKYPSHIFFAADNKVELFINGASKGQLTNWNHFASDMAYLKSGDIIGLVAKDYHVWYGVIVALFYQGEFHVTGQQEWTAREMGHISESEEFSPWMTNAQAGCGWSAAEARPSPGIYNPGKSPFFPYYTGGKYVWANGVGGRTTILLRHVVGSDPCLPVKANSATLLKYKDISTDLL